MSITVGGSTSDKRHEHDAPDCKRLSIAELPGAQTIISLKPVLYLGSTLFVVHQYHVILRSAGKHVFPVLEQAGLLVGHDLAGSIMGLAALMSSLLASHF